jgi:hypothetical protein
MPDQKKNDASDETQSLQDSDRQSPDDNGEPVSEVTSAESACTQPEDDLLWEMMDTIPETIFRAIDAITMKGKSATNARRLQACEQAVKDLLRLIAHREETGRWATLYDVAAVKAWEDEELPTDEHYGPKLASQQDAGFNNIAAVAKPHEYRRRKYGKRSKPGFFDNPLADADFTDDEEWIAEAARSSKYPTVEAYEITRDWPDLIYMWQVWKAEQYKRTKS